MLPVHKKITQPNVSTQKRVTVSYIIRNERELKHRAGVNALQYDAALNRLFSAGRDSIIRTWDCRNLNNPYIYSLEHHTDWVNDIILCCGGKNLISASSDTTVKVWNAHKGFCMSTLRTHKDYVRALAYAKDLERVASAGLDKTIFIWDINTLTALTASNNTVTTSSLTGSKNSIYSLATNPSGTVVVSGSTEKILRVWDPRTCSKLMKLIGHSDNVRGLLVNRDGTQCLSGSSDGTIKLWSLGQQQCILTIRVHKEGVWTLAATDTFNHVISAGRDRKIYKTDLRNAANSVLIGEEQNPVLRVCPVPDFSGIWVSTDNSYLSYWSLNNPASTEYNNNEGNARVNNEPSAVIEGAPAIRKYYILNDKIHVLTQDSDDNVNVYDILQARKVEDLGKVDFDEQIKKRFKMIHVPTWFNIDLKTGYLTVHLGQEENDCFSAWIALKDTNYLDYEQKINYGCMILKALFKNWKYTRSDSEKEDSTNDQIVPYDIIEVPPHTPLIITDVGKTVYRVLVQDAGGQAETHMLNECVPEWVREVLIAKKAPKQLKISFFLQPIDDVYAKNTRNYYVYKERLVANDYIQVHKIIEHVYNKLSGMEGGPVNAQPPNEKFNMTNDNKELLGSIEIICNDQVLDPEMELRAVKQHIWKSSSDLTLLYRAVKCNANNSHKS